MTTTYQKLLNKIEAFCNAHLQIKKYKGEFKEQMPNFATLDEKYPIVFVVPNGDTEGLELNQFTLEVYCLDIIQKDRANINTIVSDCHLILKDLYLYFKDGTDLEVDVIGDPTMTPLNNDLLDYAAGWVMTITFEVEGYTVCAIPMNPIPPFTPICADADYQITDTDDNVLYSGTIPSGGSLDQTIADSTATLKDTADNVLSTTQILAEGSEDIVAPDATYTVEYLNGTPIESGSIPSGGFKLIQVPNPITCADAVVNVNSVFFDNVTSGGTLNIEVRKSTGNDLVGSKQGQFWRIGDSTAVLKTSGGATISTTSIKAEESEDITAPDATVENSNASYTDSVVSGGTLVLPDITVTDSDGSTYTQPSVEDVTCTAQIKDLFWELNYNGTDDVIYIPATVNNVGTLTSGTGSNVGTITVSTDNVTYGALTFPFTPVNGTTYYFKRSTATVNGTYTMTGTYV
jgi:hypothetical protein